MSKPKKVILLVDPSERTLSLRKFLLQTHGYRVLAVRDAETAMEVLSTDPSIELLLAELMLPKMDGNELALRAKRTHPEIRTMLVSATVTSFERATHADAFMPMGESSPAEMLDRIRVLTVRKRGPKKPVVFSDSPQIERLSALQTMQGDAA